jgi:hypothetical protein
VHLGGVRAFLIDLVLNQPRGKEIHVTADNLSTRKTEQVQQFLAEHPKIPPALYSDLLLLAAMST